MEVKTAITWAADRNLGVLITIRADGRRTRPSLRSNQHAAHPDWDEFRQAQIEERRIVATFAPASAVGWIH